MDHKKLYEYWTKLADEKWKTAESLMATKRYADALFFCHLVLEAELKGLVVIRTGRQAEYTHDLLRLASIAGVEIPDGEEIELEEINTFNIRSRYDDYKSAFYKKATRAFSEEYFRKAKKLKTWVRNQSKEK